jgi:hypothetical protein
LLRLPDNRIGWRRGALAAGRALLSNWRPDIILASAPPVTTLLVAARLAADAGVPWLADLRDLWTDDPYYDFPAWRKWVDLIWERRILDSAVSLVAVTPLWGEVLTKKYRRKVHVVLNGYVEEDLPRGLDTTAERSPELSIVYTGNIYRGYRDPSALFSAISLLGPQRDSVRVHFYGPSDEDVRGLAIKHGVADRVTVHNRVSYRRSLELQMQADILLLLQWNNRADEGNIPAKLFEYLAARRPILFLGFEGGTVAQMIRDRQAGFVSNAPAEIARQLSIWIAQRQGMGVVPALDAAAKQGLGRDEQFRKLEILLSEAASAR